MTTDTARGKGIDVSNAQGRFDWPAHPGLAFAAVKAVEGPRGGEGMFYDPDFAWNWRQMREAYGNRLVRIAYCFLHPAASIEDQAAALTETVRREGLQDGDHFALDLEPYPGLATPDGLPAGVVSQRAALFCHLVNRMNPRHRCLVYCSPSTAATGCCERLGPWRLWEASWGAEEPRVPEPWRTWRLWQNSGTVLDSDVFNGTREQLLDFARMPASRR